MAWQHLFRCPCLHFVIKSKAALNWLFKEEKWSWYYSITDIPLDPKLLLFYRQLHSIPNGLSKLMHWHFRNVLECGRYIFHSTRCWNIYTWKNIYILTSTSTIPIDPSLFPHHIFVPTRKKQVIVSSSRFLPGTCNRQIISPLLCKWAMEERKMNRRRVFYRRQ